MVFGESSYTLRQFSVTMHMVCSTPKVLDGNHVCILARLSIIAIIRVSPNQNVFPLAHPFLDLRSYIYIYIYVDLF